MYLVTKRIEFCYGHRLLDYDGICKHPHGHNAVAEIDVRTDSLDSRNMVADFSDIKRLVKGWIDRELDHKMILRHDDPLVEPLRALGEPMYLLESNPTVERIAKLISTRAASSASTSSPSASGRRRRRSRRTARLRPRPARPATAASLLERQLVGQVEEQRRSRVSPPPR